MSKPPENPIKGIRTEIYRVDFTWWQRLLRLKPRAYRLFIVNYDDGSGKVYRTKDL